MKEENEITEEVRELLDSLEQHGRNARRQKELSDLIDGLERNGKALNEAKRVKTENEERKTFCFPLSVFRYSWWIVGAAAACLLLWLLVRTTIKEAPNVKEEILVEQTIIKDTIGNQEENVVIEPSTILEEPFVAEKNLAEETPIQPAKPKANIQKPTKNEKNFEEPLLAENNSSETIYREPTDTSNIGSNPIPPVIEKPLSTFHSQLSTSNSPQRRVIRSLNLVCYECKTENGERETESSQFSVLRSPFEPDPNMKNGSLAFEVKLY